MIISDKKKYGHMNLDEQFYDETKKEVHDCYNTRMHFITPTLTSTFFQFIALSLPILAICLHLSIKKKFQVFRCKPNRVPGGHS